jgi:hypothetical protein
MQERPNAVGWIVFHAIALYTQISFWLRFKRVCKWYHAPILMGGNPWARQVTHGMCKGCAKKWEAEVGKHK